MLFFKNILNKKKFGKSNFDNNNLHKSGLKNNKYKSSLKKNITEINDLFASLALNLYIPDNFSFKCTNCGSCCRGEEGVVILFEKDLKKILKKFKIDSKDFLSKYTKEYEQFISLIEKENLDCIFWEENENFKGCKIYKYKPYQCDSFPFWISVFISEKSFNFYSRKCPGFFNGNKIIKRNEILKKIYVDFVYRYEWFKYIYTFN